MNSTTTADKAPTTPRFLLLDLLRGIAAISVLIYHDADFLGGQYLPNAFLAVDLFFLLSGFVIAHNYDRKISAGMSLTDFMAQRLIRLYPCLLLTLLLGIAIFVLRFGRDYGYIDGWRILAAAGLNALFIPAIIQPYDFRSLFPFDGAAWSLTFELFANVLYWITFRHLNALRLGLLVLVAAVALAIGVSLVGVTDIGMRPADFWWGIPRVTVTFFIGVALRRYFYGRTAFQLDRMAAPVALLALLAVFSLQRFTPPGFLLAAELLAVGVFFPVLLLAVAGAVPGPRTAWLCKWTGDASYPVYLLQTPFMGVFAAIPQLFLGMKAVHFVPWIGFAHVIGTIVVALWIDRYFELPARQMLKARWTRWRTGSGNLPQPRSGASPG